EAEAEIIETSVQRYINKQAQSETGVERYINNLAETEISISDDDELQQIFLHEAVQHINSFKDAFKNIELPFTLSKELLRAAHSLKGCANIAQVMPVAAVATQLDQSLRIIYENNVSLNKQNLLLLTETIEGLDDFITHLKTPASNEPDILPLLDNLAQITPENKSSKADEEQEKLIDPEFLVVFLEETDELLSQYSHELERLQKQADNTQYQDAVHLTLSTLAENAHHANRPVLADLYQLLDKLIEQQDFKYTGLMSLLEHGYEEINNQIENLIQNKPPATISNYQQQVEKLVTQIEEDKLIQNAPTEWFSIPMDDPELLEAFTEECSELLESSNSAIRSWQENHHNAEASMQLQRVLHTIKGSARLTDIRPIADLTHHTESLVFLVADQKQDPDDSFFTLLQRSQDRLSEMQEFLARKEGIPFAHDLLTEISRFTGQVVPKPALAQVTDSDDSTTESTQDMTTSGGEQIRVRADLLDFLTNFTGEVNISRDRVGQQNAAIQQQLVEMESTVSRLQDQLRNLEIETETQILFRYEDETQDQKSDFDPLEFDRFSMIQQLSRSLTESVSDMNEITQSIDNLVHDSDAILLQQSRLSADLEQGLMNTRLLPFTGLVPRFERIIRQVNSELGKQAALTVLGADIELDRTILDRIVAPLEHIIRNAIAHGIETPETRADLEKNETGQLTLSISREGSEILLSLSDDGQGINVDKVRNRALEQGLINPDHVPSDDELIQLILTSGFSTADNISQLAGRGVGMDVVSNEIRSLKGRLSIQSELGQGTTFNIRLPLTLSIMQSLMVSSHDEQFAIPLASVHAGSRITVEEIQGLLSQEEGNAQYEFNGEYYHFIPLANLLEKPLSLPDNPKLQFPILLFRYGDMHIALLVDEINSNREIVLKSMGEQLSNISSITGATILGDGQVVFILDIPALVDSTDLTANDDDDVEEDSTTPPKDHDRAPIAMVVDDSITMRKVSSNLLKRHGFDVITAKDGIDAVAQLNEQEPDIILLDVEMPRMDGFEFATLVRNSEQYSKLPIIMITSRTGEKHRARAENIGVNAYLGKPYQELDLVEKMQELLGSHYPHAKH
ncbi:MAG: response regulator, partial [Gammaproteobacteria bacterium]|nr:response regulator [Gammaproteobacteria bacterium]